jgi:predicted peptidase
MEHLEFAPADAGKPAPLILFLHGRDESLDKTHEPPLVAVKAKALPLLADMGELPAVGGEAFPFLVICPQAATGSWEPHAGELLRLVDELVESGRADPGRCYLTGLSMGAFGCWELAAAGPGRFAALLPVSGRLKKGAADDTPAWVFTGAADDRVRAEHVIDDVAARRGAAAETTLTVDPKGVHHDEFWNHLYAQPYVYEWLLRHRRAG